MTDYYNNTNVSNYDYANDCHTKTKSINDLIIGEIVIPQYSECNQDMARTCAEYHNIDQMLNMPRCGLRNVLVKAIKKASQKYKSEYDIVMTHEGVNKVQYTIVEKEIQDRGQDLDGNVIKDPNIGVVARFYFSKENRDNQKPASECLNFFENRYHVVSQFINQEYYSQAVVFSSDDMRRSTNNMLSTIGAIQITRGNAWFVPKQCKDLVNRLSDWLSDNAGHVSRYTQLDIDQTRQSVSDACKQGLQAQLGSLQEMIQKHKLESKTRSTTLKKRSDDLNKLSATVNLYVNAIGMDLAELKNEIEQCEQDLVDFILSKEATENK